jgi:adenylate kinase family enzyme
VELDAIFHQPNWQPLPDKEFRSKVADVVGREHWVIDGNYSKVRDIVWSDAELVIILAYPRAVVIRRVTGRALRRVIGRKPLWNSNRERWSNLLSWEPGKSIIRWAWTNDDKYRVGYLEAMNGSQWSGLSFLRFTSPQQAASFIEALSVG